MGRNRSEGETVYCTNCGELNWRDSNYCHFCGKRLPHRQEETTASTDPESSDSPLRAIGVALALGIGGLVALALIFLVGLVLGAVMGLDPVWTLALAATVGQLLGFGGIAFLYLRYRGYRPEAMPSYLGLDSLSVRDLGVVLAGNVVILTSLVALLWLLEFFSLGPGSTVAQAEDPTEELGVVIYLGIIGFMICVVAPTEEILFRGVIQNRLREQFASIPAIVATSALFVLAHIQIVAFSQSLLAAVTGFTVLFIPALVFGYVYERTGNLLLPTLIHGIHNTIVVTVVFFGPDSFVRMLSF